MDDRKIRALGWANETNAQPIGLVLLGLMIAIVLAAPRRFAVVPFFILACFAARQRVVIATLDFDFIRLLVLVGWARILMRGELRDFQWKPIDTVVLLWSLARAAAYIALHKNSGAVTLQAGQLLTYAGGYYYFRTMIRTWDDVYAFVRATVFVAVPVAALFLVEKSTARNFFSAFGGIPPLTQIRYGEVRAQGAFAHPILAGCFWASLIPMYAALWWRGGGDRMLGLIGVGCSLIVVFACASSTPIVAVMSGAFAGGLFIFRDRMRAIRWGLLGVLVALHIVKNKPVWNLFVYADVIGGSTGWHRYHLIDQAIKRIPEWAVMGTTSTGHWGAGLSDVTNQFVLEGVRGGMITLILFVALISLAFGGIGRLWRVVSPRLAEMTMAWAFGTTLFVHVMSFFAVSYFGQIVTLFLIHIAIIVSLAPSPRAYSARLRTIKARRMQSAARRRAPAQQAAAEGQPASGGMA